MEKIYLFVFIILLGCKSETPNTEATNLKNDELAFEKESETVQGHRKKIKLYFWDKEKDTLKLTSYCLGWLKKPKNKDYNGKWEIEWKVFKADKSVSVDAVGTTMPHTYFDSNTIAEKKECQIYSVSMQFSIPTRVSQAFRYYVIECFKDGKALDYWDIRQKNDIGTTEVWSTRKNGNFYKAVLVIE